MRFLTPAAARKASPARREPTAPMRAAPPVGRPSWYLAGGFSSPFSRIPESENLRLYGQLRKLIPLLDVAIQKLIQFMGTPHVEADDAVKADIDQWLTTVQVNRQQYGFANWLKVWMGDMLTYGRAHTELVFNTQRNDIQGLVELCTPTIHARAAADGYGLEWVQDAAFAAPPLLLPAERMLHGFHDLRGDAPYGTSLLYSIELVGEVYTNMVRALGQTWDRMGAPGFQVHLTMPAALDDPEGTESAAARSAVQGQWEAAMNSRKNGKVRDFFSSSSADGDVRVTVIGADGQVMEFDIGARPLVEQIAAKTGLPPFLYGLQWSTTERMSEQQAKLLSEMLTWLRAEAQEPCERAIELRQQLVGRPAKFTLCWPELNLVDQMETAKAELVQAQAHTVALEYLFSLWRLGVKDQYDVARETRDDCRGKTKTEIDLLLPALATEPPEEKPLPGPMGLGQESSGGPGAGQGGRRQPAANGNGR